MSLKLHLFHTYKAFFHYHHGFKYLKNRYFLAKKIFKLNKILEKPVNHPDLSIHVLTQHKDILMLIWSLASFYQAAEVIGDLYIHNDGSLTNQDKNIIKKFFPSAVVLDTTKFLDDYAGAIEPYPWIKRFRADYQYLKKLIDPYFTSNKKYRLIIDSDLLWFQSPGEIIDEINRGCKRSLMQENYTINRVFNIHFKQGQLSDELARKNSGIVLYHRDNFNLNKLQEYFSRVDTNYQNNFHFIEQAGYAYCLTNLSGLPADKYTIKDAVNSNTVMKHYTGPRRALFYIEGINILSSKIQDTRYK